MALVCINGTRECNGCGHCDQNGGDDADFRCTFCGEMTEEGERYRNALYPVLCLECLKELHSL